MALNRKNLKKTLFKTNPTMAFEHELSQKATCNNHSPHCKTKTPKTNHCRQPPKQHKKADAATTAPPPKTQNQVA
jgi:hypothetical protein